MAVSSRLKLPVLLLRYRVTTCFLINPRFDRKKYNFVFFTDANFFFFIFPNYSHILFQFKSYFHFLQKDLRFSAWSFRMKTQPVSMYHRCLALGFLRIFFCVFSISFLWPSYIFYFSVILIFFYNLAFFWNISFIPTIPVCFRSQLLCRKKLSATCTIMMVILVCRTSSTSPAASLLVKNYSLYALPRPTATVKLHPIKPWSTGTPCIGL